MDTVIKARDQANALLRRYEGDESHGAHIATWLDRVRADVRPPRLEVSLTEWATDGNADGDGGGGGARVAGGVLCGVSSDAGLSGAGGEAGASPPASAARMWVLPVGSSMVWVNDLGADVEVHVGGVARPLHVGESLELAMHIVGMGTYEWRRVGEGCPLYVAEVRVQPRDFVTQYGTFYEDAGEATAEEAEEVTEEVEGAVDPDLAAKLAERRKLAEFDASTRSASEPACTRSASDGAGSTGGVSEGGEAAGAPGGNETGAPPKPSAAPPSPSPAPTSPPPPATTAALPTTACATLTTPETPALAVTVGDGLVASTPPSVPLAPPSPPSAEIHTEIGAEIDDEVDAETAAAKPAVGGPAPALGE